MKIIQTFWTAEKDPMKNGFGWRHPQYNLMSWALSCLSLRALYDEVELYTDSAGYHILIEVLKLPYTKTHVIFDDFQCLPNHWALSKIKTYSLQTEPFLHVDGDIYVPRPLPEEIMDAPLVAQNREVGTAYYRQMVDERVLRFPAIKLPEYVEKGIHEDSLASYNMGFFGGTDIDFIQAYCREVFHFMEENRMNNPKVEHAHTNCCVFFEQIIFALFCDHHQREVAGLLKDVRQDKGYTFDEFCDLTYYRLRPFFHLLGGHKRKKRAENLLETCLLTADRDLFRHILALFPEKNVRFNTQKRKKATCNIMSIEKSMAIYEDWLHTNLEEWKNLPTDELIENAQRASVNSDILMPLEKKNKLVLSRNPHLKLFRIPEGWNPEASVLLLKKLEKEELFPLNVLADVPSISGKGHREDAYTQIELDILGILDATSMRHEEIMNIIHKKLSQCGAEAIKALTTIYEDNIKKLIRQEVLFAN